MASRRSFLALLSWPIVARFIPPPLKVTSVTTAGETTPSFVLSGIPAAPAGVVGRRLYRSDGHQPGYKLIATMGANDTEWTRVDPCDGERFV